MKKNLAVLINFCTNEYPFLKACAESALQVADQVLISVCDHFFDAVPEDRRVLQRAYVETLRCTFFEYAFDPEKNFYGGHPPSFWHDWGRLIGFFHVDPSIEYLLFLDVDEILDPASFSLWFEKEKHLDAEWLESYWYFRQPNFRARRREENALLVRRAALSSAKIMHHLERAGTFFQIEGEKRRHVAGLDGLPMVHHYSWVRSKEQMLRKVSAWGHREDCAWKDIVEAEFAREFSGKDFVYGGLCDTVPAFIHLSAPSAIEVTEEPKNVHRISTDEMHEIERELL